MNTEKAVLNYFIQNLGNYTSGEELSNQLNISRTAVWKAVKQLKEQGYEISSKTRKGYCLVDNGVLNTALINKYLHTDNLDLHVYETIGSTNSEAKNISSQRHSTEPLVIISDQQTAGYGRYGRKFESPKNTGIYMSILLENQHQNDLNPGLLTTAVAIAVSRTIKKLFHKDTEIKWVNDVLLDGKKICGILTEGVANLETQSISQVIIGIGINYTTPLEVFPAELRERVGSLKDLAEEYHVSRNIFISCCLDEFFAIYRNYTSADFMDEYRKLSVVIGKEVRIKQGNKIITGVVSTIDDLGRIVLTDGQIFSSGEVTKIRY